jgi:hypothetical protein
MVGPILWLFNPLPPFGQALLAPGTRYSPLTTTKVRMGLPFPPGRLTTFKEVGDFSHDAVLASTTQSIR